MPPAGWKAHPGQGPSAPPGETFAECTCSHTTVASPHHIPTPQGQEAIGHLRDGWADTPVRPGDSLNIVGSVPEPWVPGGPLHLVADMHKGLVILHPDVLLSGVRGFSFIYRESVTCCVLGWGIFPIESGGS